MRAARVCAAALLLLGSSISTARAEPGAEREWKSVPLERLGLRSDALRYSTQASFGFPLNTRGDEVLTGIRLELELDPERFPEELAGIAVAVNGERAGRLSRAQLGPKARFEVDPHLVGAENHVSLELELGPEAPCRSRVPRGTWRLVKGGAVELAVSPLPLENDLGLLPLPFFDRNVDAEAAIPVVFLGPVTPAAIRAGSLIAAWFGLHVDGKRRFAVHLGELPESSAVVLLGGAWPGLEVPGAGPRAAMLDHPRHPRSPHKLLVIAGTDGGELEAAALAFAVGEAPLEGPWAALPAPPPPRPRRPYDAPRWFPADGVGRLEAIPGGRALVHQGLGDGALTLRFRMAPDLFSWPREHVRFELHHGQRVPPGVEVPRLEIEVNGQFVGTLPPPRSPDGELETRMLELRRDHLFGYNELRFFIDAAGAEEACDVPSEAAQVQTHIAGSSVLELGTLPHFAPMPNLALFVDDGFPFTHLADLGETVIVIPDQPHASEVAAVLSFAAHAAEVTGVPGTRVTVLAASSAGPRQLAGKDVLVIGSPGSQPLIGKSQRWAPLELGEVPTPRVPSIGAWVQKILGGESAHGELARARAALSGGARHAFAFGFESPYSPGRSVVVIAASTPDRVPTLAELQGFAETRYPTNDLLVLSGDARRLFRIGPTYEVGSLPVVTRLRWRLSEHWVLLFPLALVGAVSVATALFGGAQRRAMERLGGGGS